MLVPAHSTAALREAAEHWAAFRFEQALAFCRDGLERQPAESDLALFAAQRLFSVGRFAESLEFLDMARRRRPEDVDLLWMTSEVLERAGREEEAEPLAREALEKAPRSVPAARALAHLLRHTGRLAEAEEIIRRRLALDATPEDWRLNYELAAVLDQPGRENEAMSALLRAKEQLRPAAHPHLSAWRTLAQRRLSFAHGLTRPTLTAWQNDLPSDARRRLAVLAGHPRSGTTLLERLLTAHPDVVSTDETGVLRTQFIAPIVHAAVSAESALRETAGFDADQIAAGRDVYFEATRAHIGEDIGARLLVEKDPLATQDLGFILRLLPESAVLFPLRDPRDVCLSVFFTLLPLNTDSAPALDLHATAESVALSLRLWQHWREIMPQRWAEIRYEDLVRQPEQEMRRVAETCRLPWHPAVLSPHPADRRGVRTPSYSAVTQPIHGRAVGRWRRYAPWLEPHLGPLAKLLSDFGYE